MLDARVGRYPHTRTLFAAPLAVGAEELVFQRAIPGSTARAMMRELAYDVCEMPLVNYLSAREQGIPLVALPVFLSRRFPHPMLVCNVDAGLETPRDLEGRRVGIGYYGNTDTTWVQVMLAAQFGVDCGRITWVASQQEQVPGRSTPANVERVGETAQTTGTDALPSPALGEMLHEGSLDAVVYGVPTWDTGDPRLRQLLDPAEPYARGWWRETEVFPILHTLVLAESAVRRRPDLPRIVYDAFVSAKAAACADPRAALGDDELRQAAIKTGFTPDVDFPLGADPLPYGVEANRANLELLIEHAVARGVLDAAPDIHDAFPDLIDRTSGVHA